MRPAERRRAGRAARARLRPGCCSAPLRGQAWATARGVVYVLGAALLLLAAVNTALLAWTSVLDTARPSALVRALGATPRQVVAGLAVAQLLPALAAALIGIPGGLALFRVASDATGGNQTSGTVPPLPWLLAVVPATLLATAAITFIPSRLGARHPVVAALRYE